ncbi:Unknown protein sequence [Pseudomonas savastanoi pv. phaseolicola]|nr:Unknown protein sequence [Pseudomonas savastanoi pv. phaseolicola]
MLCFKFEIGADDEFKQLLPGRTFHPRRHASSISTCRQVVVQFINVETTKNVLSFLNNEFRLKPGGSGETSQMG